MPDGSVTLLVNGERISMPEGAMVSAALLTAQAPFRLSIGGQPRAAFCGMGICFECRAVVDGVAHARTCQIVCSEGMQVETQP